MSEFAFFRFRSQNMLTIEEEQHKDEIMQLTEEVLEAKGIECDSNNVFQRLYLSISNGLYLLSL